MVIVTVGTPENQECYGTSTQFEKNSLKSKHLQTQGKLF